MDSPARETTPTGDKTFSGNPHAAPTLEAGTILLGKFRVVELLGVGGMGSVYRVDHLLMERQFALKCLNKYQEADASWRRFQNEAKAAHFLDHPNLLKIFEFGLLQNGQPYFLMELIEGITLSDEIKRLGHLPIERAVSIFIQVAFAIGCAHERRIIHRDLKPSNIMLVPPKSERETEGVKVVDFGIAKLTGIDEFSQQTLTKTGEVFGSPFYMSPEQCAGLPADQRSDLYSLGCVFYETLTSAPPFMGESALATMMKHQSDKPLPLKEASLGLNYPAFLEAIICKLLEKEPDKRYQSADKLAADLITLERDFNQKKEASGAGGQIRPGLRQDRRETSRVWLSPRSLNAAKLVCFGISMYILGASSIFLITKFPDLNKKTETKPKPVIDRQFWSQIEGNRKIFYFPPQSLGYLLGANGGNGKAMNRVQVPIGERTGLIAGRGLFENPAYIEKFRPEEVLLLDVLPKETKPEVFPAFKWFTELRCLNVGGTAFSDKDLEILPYFKKLLFLNMSTSDVDCATLLKMKCIYNLNCLDISHLNNAEAILPVLDKFPKLHFLAMSVCGLGDSDMKLLAKCKTLRIVCMSTNSITDQGIANLIPMKNLEWLDISQNAVSPACSRSLRQMTNLRKLEMGPRIEWGMRERKKFIDEIKSANSRIEVVFENTATFDPAAMPEFQWNGLGLGSHPNCERIISDPHNEPGENSN